MNDRMPTPEEIAAAATELAEARAAQSKADLNFSNAREAYNAARARTDRAAAALRAMTDRLAPPPQKGVAVA